MKNLTSGWKGVFILPFDEKSLLREGNIARFLRWVNEKERKPCIRYCMGLRLNWGKRFIELLAKELKAGVIVEREFEKTQKGCPQDSPLSPMLSSILLKDWFRRRRLLFLLYLQAILSMPILEGVLQRLQQK
jgi:hypothetical protein